MQRHKVWLGVVVNAIVGAAVARPVTHAYAVDGDLRLELGQLAIMIIVALLGLGVAGLTFLAWLKR